MASPRLLASVGTRFQSVWTSFIRPIHHDHHSASSVISSVSSRRSFLGSSCINQYTCVNQLSTTCRLVTGVNGWLSKVHLSSQGFIDTLSTERANSINIALVRCVSTKPRERLSKQYYSSKGKLPRRNCSSKHKTNQNKTETEVVTESENLSVFQRFKKAYKEHGKVLITVHVATSTVWLVAFYFAAKSGVDVVPLLEKMGASDTIIKPFKSSGLGSVAVGYLLYKLATPARYTLTLGGTNLAIRYLRNTGHMKPIQEGQRLRELYKDSKTELRSQQKKISTKLRDERIEKIKKFKEARRNKKQ